MSYRAFKRLLGETSLERKCRFLFGAFILVLIAVSFSLYAGRTEKLAYEQMSPMSRLLVYPIVVKQHVKDIDPKQTHDDQDRQRLLAMREFRANWEDENWPKILDKYTFRFDKPGT